METSFIILTKLTHNNYCLTTQYSTCFQNLASKYGNKFYNLIKITNKSVRVVPYLYFKALERKNFGLNIFILIPIQTIKPMGASINHCGPKNHSTNIMILSLVTVVHTFKHVFKLSIP